MKLDFYYKSADSFTETYEIKGRADHLTNILNNNKVYLITNELVEKFRMSFIGRTDCKAILPKDILKTTESDYAMVCTYDSTFNPPDHTDLTRYGLRKDYRVDGPFYWFNIWKKV